MYAYFNHGFEIEMTQKQAEACSHQGECINDVLALLKESKIKRQLDKIGVKAIRDELKEYGAWDDTELADHEANRQRIVWIAAGNIMDELHEKERG